VDKYIIPMVESIIQNDVAEFKPYAFQLIGNFYFSNYLNSSFIFLKSSFT